MYNLLKTKNQKGEIMAKIFEDAYLASLGVAFLTYEKAEKLTQNLVKKGELAKARQKEFIQELMDKARTNTEELENTIKDKFGYLVEKGKPLKEKQEEIIEDITEKTKKTSRATEEKIRDLIKNVTTKAKETAEKQQRILVNLKKKIVKSDEEKIIEILKKSDIPTRDEIEEIKKRLDELVQKGDV